MIMFKTLLKKQFTDIFQSFFINKKNGEAKSRNKTVSSIVFFVILMVVVMGGIFFSFAYSLCGPLTGQGLDWMYFMLISITSVSLGSFGSVFNTFATLYKAKDNDLLLSLPIPAKIIVLTRLSGVYLLGLMYSMIVYIPAQIIYFINAGFHINTLITTAMFAVIISLLVLVLSCALGWVVAKISLKIKNKSIVTVLTALLFMVLYYIFCFRINELLSKLLVNALEISEKIIGKAYVLYFIGSAAAGDIVKMIVCTAVSVLLAYGVYMMITKSFLKIASSSQKEKKTVYREKAVKAKTPFGAFLSKELTHFINDPNYILNSGLGTIMLPIGAVAILFKGADIKNILMDVFPGIGPYIMPIFAALMCLVSTMNDITAPSISIEGRNIWIAQSLPVKTITVLYAKIALHILLTEIPVLLCGICAAIAFKFSVVESLVLILFVSSFVLLDAFIGISANLKSPNLTWTNETIAIKQGLSVMVAIFGSWGYILVLGAIVFALSLLLSPAAGAAVAVLINAALCFVFYKWLRTKGVRIFESL